MLSTGLESRLVSLHKYTAARALLHGLEARAFGADYHTDEVDAVRIGNFDALLQQFRVLQQAVDVGEHAWAPVVVVRRCV